MFYFSCVFFSPFLFLFFHSTHFTIHCANHVSHRLRFCTNHIVFYCACVSFVIWICKCTTFAMSARNTIQTPHIHEQQQKQQCPRLCRSVFVRLQSGVTAEFRMHERQFWWRHENGLGRWFGQPATSVIAVSNETQTNPAHTVQLAEFSPSISFSFCCCCYAMVNHNHN